MARPDVEEFYRLAAFNDRIEKWRQDVAACTASCSPPPSPRAPQALPHPFLPQAFSPEEAVVPPAATTSLASPIKMKSSRDSRRHSKPYIRPTSPLELEAGPGAQRSTLRAIQAAATLDLPVAADTNLLGCWEIAGVKHTVTEQDDRWIVSQYQQPPPEPAVYHCGGIAGGAWSQYLPDPFSNPLITYNIEDITAEYHRILEFRNRLVYKLEKAEAQYVFMPTHQIRQHILDLGADIQRAQNSLKYIQEYNFVNSLDIDLPVWHERIAFQTHNFSCDPSYYTNGYQNPVAATGWNAHAPIVPVSNFTQELIMSS